MSSIPEQSIRNISKNLYIGDFMASINCSELVQHGITHILVCGKELCCRYPDRFVYKQILVDDSPSQPIYKSFEESYQFIQRGMRQGCVLVHCAQAKSRSVTIILSFLMKSQHLKFKKAFDLLRKRHPQAEPNSGFRRQLIEYEKTIGVDEGCMNSIF